MKHQKASAITVHYLENITEWFGKGISWLNLVLILTLVYEVVCRYIFNRPTMWSFDISYMLGSTAFAIGAAWTLKKDIHVRVDILYSRLSPKAQGLIDILLSLILFFPFITMAFVYSTKAAAFSWSTHERIISGYWNPPIYPLKTIIAIAYGLLLVQGMAGFVRTVYRLRGEDL